MAYNNNKGNIFKQIRNKIKSSIEEFEENIEEFKVNSKKGILNKLKY
jgi:hypothetical protein